MSDENKTDLSGIKNATDSISIKDCKVIIENCFKQPFRKSQLTERIKLKNNAIVLRRRSLRLQNRSMKTPNRLQLDKEVEPPDTAIHNLIVSNVHTVNSAQIVPNKFNLSDDEIMELYNEVSSFIENGTWDALLPDTTELGFLSPSLDLTPVSASLTIGNIDRVNAEHHSELLNSDETTRGTSNTTSSGTNVNCVQPSTRLSISTQTDFPDQCSQSTQTDQYQIAAATQTYFDNQCSISTQSSLKECHKDKSVTSTKSKSLTQTNAENVLDSNIRLPIKSKGHSKRKRKEQPIQTSVQNFELNECSTNRKVLNFKIPKLEQSSHGINRGEPSISVINRDEELVKTERLPFASQTNYQLGSSNLLTPKSNVDSMKNEVRSLLQRPCLTFLSGSDCSSYCKQNHLLPSAIVVAKAIKYWSNELIQYFYVTYIQRYMMCYSLYFEVICDAFVKRRLPDTLLSIVKDCERLTMEDNLNTIFLGLKKCGYTQDDALFEICTHAYRHKNTMNEIMKIITSFEVLNFKRTIAFLFTDIEKIDFNPCYGNEVLKQACERETLDVCLLEFCYAVIRKYHGILNVHYMRKLLSKM